MKKKKDEVTIRSSAAEYLTYVASVGDQQDSVELRYEDENIWLTQKMMAILYDIGLPTINEHIKKIYAGFNPGKNCWYNWRVNDNTVAATNKTSEHTSSYVSLSNLLCS